MSIKIKTISMVQLPPPKSQKNLFHVTLTNRKKGRILRPFFMIRTAVIYFIVNSLVLTFERIRSATFFSLRGHFIR